MSNATNAPDARSYWTARTALVLRFVLALAFLAAGGAKLAGMPDMVQVFDSIGIGQWFRLVTGAVEISGAILLLIPGMTGLGAALLTVTMAGAVLTHLAVIGGNPGPAIVLFLLSAFVLWIRRGDLTRLVKSTREAVA